MPGRSVRVFTLAVALLLCGCATVQRAAAALADGLFRMIAYLLEIQL